jgi:hydroxymethylbilane synthase
MSHPKPIRIATRQSPLALWQANHIKEQLKKQHPEAQIELLPMLSSGDKFTPNDRVNGKALFVKELEEALLDGRADLAVHSTKDMPAQCPQGLCITAICRRDNPYDAFVSLNYPTLEALPHQASIGTISLRRQAQLLALRPDFEMKPLRGNIQTRLAKLEAGEYHAIILASAGLERMGLNHYITEILREDLMLPACGQGALCIECREDDADIRTLVAHLNDELTALCVHAERLVSACMGAHCHLPFAVFGKPIHSERLQLCAKLFSLDGKTSICAEQMGPLNEAQLLAEQCANALFAQGAADLLARL